LNDVSEIAALRQRLKELDDERKELLARLDRLKDESPPQVTPLGFPAATKAPATAEEKVALFLSLFRCREDVFPKLWMNARKGTKGYSPACRNEWTTGLCRKSETRCSDCSNRSFFPLDEAAVEGHLRGTCTIGTYAIRADDTSVFLACDLDGRGWQDDVAAYRSAGLELGIDVSVERSRSGNGAHAWVFFAEPVPARLARQLGTMILSRALDARPEMSFKSYDRFFPNQDFLPRGGFGNLIALPLQKVPREQGNSVFLNSQLEPVPEQWEFLAQVRRLSLSDVNAILQPRSAQPSAALSDGVTDIQDVLLSTDSSLLVPYASGPELQRANGTVMVRVGSQILIPLDGLFPRLIAGLKRLAAFPNPEFYKRNRMRLPTYLHPRIVFSGEMRRDELILPRGVLDQAVQLLEDAGATVNVQDERPKSGRIRARFRGTLTAEQKTSVRALERHEFGVFVAPPGAGKTVVACALIARRKVPTLVLVHRQPLVEQWRSRLLEFLSLGEKDIGIVSGTKKRTSGKVDIAMLQTLGRADDIREILPGYAQVIVDECHHIPASSFELVLKQLPARFVLGLTATPYRKDGLQKIIHFQCGPIRHETRLAGQGELSRRVIVRETGFRVPDEAGGRAPIHVIWHYLVRDSGRNDMIAGDVAEALRLGRTPLVISDRKDHLRALADEIERKTADLPCRVFRLDGEVPVAARKKILQELRSALEQRQRVCLLSTASLIGEGFDLPPLDTLFLAMPISFKGRVVQYAGRLHRSSEGKTSVLIYDYVDTSCALALKMYHRRLPAYRNMEYSVDEPPTMIGSRPQRRAHPAAGRPRNADDSEQAGS
jgi:superfamily II DNA or RNA helicase